MKKYEINRTLTRLFSALFEALLVCKTENSKTASAYSQDETMVERREMERLSMEMTARVSSENNPKDGKWITVRTKNICAGGAFFSSGAGHLFPVGTRLHFEAVLYISKKTSMAKKALMKTSGVVIRKEETGTAIRFKDEYKILPLPEHVLH